MHARGATTIRARPQLERRQLSGAINTIRRAPTTTSITSSTKGTPIPALPADIIAHVFKFLLPKHDRKTLLVCSLVCKRWFYLARPRALRRVELVLEWERRCRSFLVLLHTYAGSGSQADNGEDGKFGHLLRRSISMSSASTSGSSSRPSSSGPSSSAGGSGAGMGAGGGLLPSFMRYTQVVRLDLDSDTGGVDCPISSLSSCTISTLARLTSVVFLQLIHHQESPNRLESILQPVRTTFRTITGLSLTGLYFPSQNVLAEFVCSFPYLKDLTLSDVQPEASPASSEPSRRIKAGLSLSLERLCLVVDKKEDMPVIWLIKLASFRVTKLIIDAKVGARRLWEGVHAVLVKYGSGVEHLDFQRTNNLQAFGASLQHQTWKLPNLRTLSIVLRQHPDPRLHDRQSHLLHTLSSLAFPHLSHIHIKLTDIGLTSLAERAKEGRTLSLDSFMPSSVNWDAIDEEVVRALGDGRLPELSKVSFSLGLVRSAGSRKAEHKREGSGTAEALEVVGKMMRCAFWRCRRKRIWVDVGPSVRIPWDWDGQWEEDIVIE